MTEEPRDELDRALGRGLSGLASGVDADAALTALRPHLRRARTRRRVAQATAGVVALAAVISVAGAITASHNDRVRLASATTTTRAHRTTTSMAHTTTTTAAPSPSTSVTPTTRPLSSSPTTAPPVSTPGTTETPTSVPTTVSTPTTTSAPGLHTYRSEGGTLTVRFEHGSLSLVSYHANAGYTAELHTNQPDEIEVRFYVGAEEVSRLGVRVENGQLVTDD